MPEKHRNPLRHIEETDKRSARKRDTTFHSFLGEKHSEKPFEIGTCFHFYQNIPSPLFLGTFILLEVESKTTSIKITRCFQGKRNP